jgi:hypothetical protein
MGCALVQAQAAHNVNNKVQRERGGMLLGFDAIGSGKFRLK